MAIYTDVLCWWDDEATKAVGAHNREQKHRNRYTRPGIADSRCVPCCLGLFRREWEKTLQPRALTCSYCSACAVGGQGLRAGSAVRHVEQSTFDFRSGIIRAEIMGMTGHAPQFEAERGLAVTAQDAHMLPCPEVTGPGPLQPFPIHPYSHSHTAASLYSSMVLSCCLHGDSGPRART